MIFSYMNIYSPPNYLSLTVWVEEPLDLDTYFEGISPQLLGSDWMIANDDINQRIKIDLFRFDEYEISTVVGRKKSDRAGNQYIQSYILSQHRKVAVYWTSHCRYRWVYLPRWGK